MSCAGNGYLSGNMLVPFPIEDGQCLAWAHDAEEAQQVLQRCFVDAGIYISGHSIPQGGWPSLAVVSLTGWRLRMKLRACGSEVEIVTDATSEGARGFPSYSGTAEWGHYVVVVSLEGVMNLISFCNEHSISPPAPDSSSPSGQEGCFWLRLCTKCVSLSPRQLESIRVLDGTSPTVFGSADREYSPGEYCWKNKFYRCVEHVSKGEPWNDDKWVEVGVSDVLPSFIIRDRVDVKPGNNALLEKSDEYDGVEINATPGAGLGTISCGCSGRTESVSPIISPDGHTRIFNDTCYDLEPADLWTRVVNGEARPSRNLKIHVKCTSCCTCDMYESIVNERLKNLADIIRNARDSIYSGAESYEEAVRRFNLRIKNPSISDITLSLSGMPAGSRTGSHIHGSGVTGKMNRCAFSAVVRNSSYFAVKATVLSIEGTSSVVEVSASWTEEDGNPKNCSGDSGGSITGKSFMIMPGKSLAVTFVSVKSEMVGSVSTGGYSGSISLAVSYRTRSGGYAGLGTISKTIEV